MTVDVPLNTMLADLDEALRALLKRELGRHGFEGVEIAFDAPAKDWSGKLTSPTVNLFLYDLREAAEQRRSTPRDVRVNGGASSTPAAAAARGHLRRHGLDEGGRGRAPAALAGARDPLRLPHAARRPARRAAADARPRSASRSRPRSGGPQRGQGRLLDVGRRPVQGVGRLRRAHRRASPARPSSAGPRCATQTAAARASKDGPPRDADGAHRFGGTVRDADGEPVADAWVALPDSAAGRPPTPTGASASTACPPGTHRVRRAHGDGRGGRGRRAAYPGTPRRPDRGGAAKAPPALTVRATEAARRLPARPVAAVTRCGRVGAVAAAPPPRVLLGNLEPIMALGLRRHARRRRHRGGGPGGRGGRGCCGPRERLRPDAVVLDLNHGGARALADAGPAASRRTRRCPLGARRDRDGGPRPRRATTRGWWRSTTPEGLRSELRGSTRHRVEE